MTNYLHTIEMEVRDYECDVQGIVGHSIYLDYLLHARVMALKQIGIEFAALNQQGVFIVAIRLEIDYKTPLRSGDAFSISSRLERVSRLRFAFVQDIVRASDKALVIHARVIAASMNASGRPFLPKELEAVLARHAGSLPDATSPNAADQHA